jgi:hypothetical protein
MREGSCGLRHGRPGTLIEAVLCSIETRPLTLTLSRRAGEGMRALILLRFTRRGTLSQGLNVAQSRNRAGPCDVVSQERRSIALSRLAPAWRERVKGEGPCLDRTPSPPGGLRSGTPDSTPFAKHASNVGTPEE